MIEHVNENKTLLHNNKMQEENGFDNKKRQFLASGFLL